MSVPRSPNTGPRQAQKRPDAYRALQTEMINSGQFLAGGNEGEAPHTRAPQVGTTSCEARITSLREPNDTTRRVLPMVRQAKPG